MRTIVIPKRFSGPPNCGNGGYTCAQVAAALGGGPAEVTLRKPIPLEKPMSLAGADGRMLLKLGEELIAEGQATEFTELSAPKVSFAEAETAAAKSPAFMNHPFPTCFVCGPERPPGDGLRIFPGVAKERDHTSIFAAPWVPAAEFADKEGNVRAEFVWAALDCPTGFAGGFPYEGKLVTGRLATELVAPLRAGERSVILSWRTGVEGRKHHSVAMLVGEDGTLRAQARATWIKL